MLNEILLNVHDDALNNGVISIVICLFFIISVTNIEFIMNILRFIICLGYTVALIGAKIRLKDSRTAKENRKIFHMEVLFILVTVTSFLKLLSV